MPRTDAHKTFLGKWWRGLLYDPRDYRPVLDPNLKIVAIGGGTGLATLLRGLKHYSNSLTAIITCTDDGASSGELRREFDILPPGDIRKSISALTPDEQLMSQIFEYRFPKKSKIFYGHTLGNIWLTGLTEYLGSFEKAIELTSELFKTSGRILPVSLDKVHVGAIYDDKTKVVGETKIASPDKNIAKLFLDKRARAYQKSVEVIKNADLILIGPGSLYTSVLPNLLVGGIRKGIGENKKAIKIYVANCSTERGETQNLSVEDHIREVEKYLGTNILNFCLANNKIVRTSKSTSRLGTVNNIRATSRSVGGCKIVKADVINRKIPLFHNPQKLAKAIVEIYNNQGKSKR